ncbi:GlxA family transcriptional regulator [Pseudoalteromonas fenneropenaei]|uniref:GlxA family transcriptional regulator n=1 Tax=Pseudoalteromonas fenneropenaei TaxID=1737459 RepID=A0ABV7CJZ0_9GAMM
MTKKLLFFIADGFQALDLFGPLDAFMETNDIVPQAYYSQLMSLSAGAVKTAYGQSVNVELGLADVIEFDDLIICGGTGMRQLRLSAQQGAQLKQLADRAQRVISICTGAFILPQIYPQQALTLTTHWRHCQQLAQQAGHCQVKLDPLFINDGKVWSSAGVLSGVDLALALIGADYGNAIAAKVAKELVVYLQRGGQQTQYSDLLALQNGESLRLSALLEWLPSQLQQAITVEQMADKACVSTRQLTRLFKLHLGSTPSLYVRKLRLERARDLLSQAQADLANVASQVGFTHYDSFRRAFNSYFGVSPLIFMQHQARS